MARQPWASLTVLAAVGRFMTNVTCGPFQPSV